MKVLSTLLAFCIALEAPVFAATSNSSQVEVQKNLERQAIHILENVAFDADAIFGGKIVDKKTGRRLYLECSTRDESARCAEVAIVVEDASGKTRKIGRNFKMQEIAAIHDTVREGVLDEFRKRYSNAVELGWKEVCEDGEATLFVCILPITAGFIITPELMQISIIATILGTVALLPALLIGVPGLAIGATAVIAAAWTYPIGLDIIGWPVRGIGMILGRIKVRRYARMFRHISAAIKETFTKGGTEVSLRKSEFDLLMAVLQAD